MDYTKNVNKLCKIILLFITILLVLSELTITVKADDSGSLYLDKLKFNVTINKDGSMDVVEIWDIDISNTNTLYKTFKTDNDKFTSIKNVRVKDVTANKEFTQINEEMYHVTENCYYGLVNSKGDFEIAWGVGLDNKYATRTYEISYTVVDAIGKYNDYAELYWQFVGEDFEVDADKITGTITLPSNAKKEEDIKVWGHTESLNGEIYVTDTNEIKFQVENFYAGRYVEVRALFPTDMIESTGRTYNENRYDEVIKEETKWANQANLKRKWEEIEDEVVAVFLIFVVLALCIIFIERAVKYGKKLSTIKKYMPEQKLDYFRELPDKNATPGEAVYILKEPYNAFSRHFGKIFSATLLDLKLKGYIDLRVEKAEKNKDKIYLKKLKESDSNLKGDEKRILNFVQNVDKISDQNNISDYSPEFKLKMLELDKNKINGKVLELGCGKDGSLVEFLRKIGIDAYGIDQMCDDTSFLVCDDLTTYEYEENKYDLIIAYMTFSKDFLKAHTDQTTDFIDYAETFMKILNSLKVNGTFVYIPAIPFIEELLPEDKFLVHNSFLKDGEIMKTNIKRLK